MIRADAELAKRIREEGEGAYPNECCGFLLGRSENDESRTVETIIPMVNAGERAEQYHRFKIEPEDFMAAEKEAVKQNRDLLGFYHSHPDHPASPSEYDRDHGLPFYSYVIVSVARGTGKDITSWTLSENREFVQEEIIWR
jgi:proteasome lid subunit RPN8/RPN11